MVNLALQLGTVSFSSICKASRLFPACFFRVNLMGSLVYFLWRKISNEMKAVKNNQFYPQKIKKTTTKKTDIKEFHFCRTFFFLHLILAFRLVWKMFQQPESSENIVIVVWMSLVYVFWCLLHDWKINFPFFFFSWIGKNAFSPSTHQLPKILMMLCPVNNSLTVWDIFYKILLSVYVQQLTCPYIYIICLVVFFTKYE